MAEIFKRLLQLLAAHPTNVRRAINAFYAPLILCDDCFATGRCNSSDCGRDAIHVGIWRSKHLYDEKRGINLAHLCKQTGLELEGTELLLIELNRAEALSFRVWEKGYTITFTASSGGRR